MAKDIFEVKPDDAWPYADEWVASGDGSLFDVSIEWDTSLFDYNTNIATVAALPDSLIPLSLMSDVRFVRLNGCIQPLIQKISAGDL